MGTFTNTTNSDYTPIPSDKIDFNSINFVGPLTQEQRFELNKMALQNEMPTEELPMDSGDDDIKTDEEKIAALDEELTELRKKNIELEKKKKHYAELLQTSTSASLAQDYQKILEEIEQIKARRKEILEQKKTIEYKECHLNSLFEKYPKLEEKYIRLKSSYEGMKRTGIADQYEAAKEELKRHEQELLEFKEAAQKNYELSQNKEALLKYLELEEQFNNAPDSEKSYYGNLMKQQLDYMKSQNFILNARDLNKAIKETAKVLGIEPELIDIPGAPSKEDIEKIEPKDSNGNGAIHGGELDPNIRNWDSSEHHTGLGGAFEGPQGKETAYDARLISKYPKSDYSKPDNALLKQLINLAKDANGNYLFPHIDGMTEDEMVDYYFGAGSPYEYHIYGINADGTVDQSKINDPKFGLKMLGNYIMVGTGTVNGEQQRELGSFVITSVSGGQQFPGIVVDSGDTDTQTHIDMSMDQVLYHLRHFAVNRNLEVKSLAGFYDWCTPDDFTGPLDKAYEMMFRRYCRNTGQACPLDSPNFPYREYLNYSSQADFLAKEPEYAACSSGTPYNP